MIICHAAFTTWALIFGPDPAWECYANATTCEFAASGANAMAGLHHMPPNARCVQQPPNPDMHVGPELLTPWWVKRTP